MESAMERKNYLTNVKFRMPVICGLFNHGNFIEATLTDCQAEGMIIVCKMPFKENSTLIIRLKDEKLDTKSTPLPVSLRSMTLAKVISCEPIALGGDELYKIEVKYKCYQ
jgi:hypothetical protein